MFLIKVFGLAVTFLSVVQGASILALFSSLSFSDHQVFRSYVSLLVQRGHSAVVMTPYPGRFQYPDTDRIVELDVGQESAPFWEEFKMLSSNTDDYYTRMKALNEYSLKLAIAQLKSKQMTALLVNPNIKFDLVITEADVPVLYAAADKYKAPHITISTSNGKIHQHEAKGNPVNPTMYLDVNTMDYGNLTLWQKVSEYMRYYHTRNEYYGHYLPLSDLAARKIFGLDRKLQDVEYDIDLLLIASNPALVGNRPVVPATSYVDRLHVTPGLTLPQDLQEILDKSTKGAIYFSVGAVQECEQLSPKLLETLADAFRELPYTVLWKIGNTTVIKKPDNVLAQVWFPQQQLLAHPNIKVFLTHGGPRSLEEAVFYHVPIVGLPLVKSRKPFIREITKHGAGEILDPYYLDKETVKSVLNEVASNPKYRNAMMQLKEKITDPLISGPDNAIWWTEYVLRNRGARHLRSAEVGGSLAKLFYLDILFYLLLLSLVTFYLVFKLLKLILIKLRNRIFKRDLNLPSKFKEL